MTSTPSKKGLDSWIMSSVARVACEPAGFFVYKTPVPVTWSRIPRPNICLIWWYCPNSSWRTRTEEAATSNLMSTPQANVGERNTRAFPIDMEILRRSAKSLESSILNFRTSSDTLISSIWFSKPKQMTGPSCDSDTASSMAFLMTLSKSRSQTTLHRGWSGRLIRLFVLPNSFHTHSSGQNVYRRLDIWLHFTPLIKTVIFALDMSPSIPWSSPLLLNLACDLRKMSYASSTKKTQL